MGNNEADWKYNVDYLAWENGAGQLSITNPAEEITLVDDRASWDKANRELDDLSAAMAYRTLWPDNDKAVRKAFLLMRPQTSSELVEDLIKRTAPTEATQERKENLDE